MKNNNSLVYSSSGLLALLIIVYPVLAYIEADLTLRYMQVLDRQ
jgi:hypothetical protein